MLDHPSDDELATLALSPEVTASSNGSAMQHVEACEQCRARIEGVQRAMRAVDMLAEHVQAPALGGLRDRIESELSRGLHAGERSVEQSEAARVIRIPPIRPIERLRAIFPLVASIVLALIAGKGSSAVLTLGLECAAVELGSALAMLTAFTIVARGALARSPSLKQALHDRATILFASVAGTGALLGQVYLHQRCPGHDQMPHLLLFHVGAVLVATATAAALAPLARRWHWL